MTLVQIAILAVLAALLGRLHAGRQLALLAASSAVLFWLQPSEPIAVAWFLAPRGHHRTHGCLLVDHRRPGDALIEPELAGAGCQCWA